MADQNSGSRFPPLILILIISTTTDHNLASSPRQHSLCFASNPIGCTSYCSPCARSSTQPLNISAHQQTLRGTDCRQMFHDRSRRGHPSTIIRCPQGRRFGRGHPQYPHFHLNGWQSNLRWSRPYWTRNMLQYIPVEGQDAPEVMTSLLSVDNGPLVDPDASLRLYHFLKRRPAAS